MKRPKSEPSGQMNAAGPIPLFAEPSRAPVEQKQERLYAAIERAQTFMHKRTSPGKTMASIRRYFPDPRYFMESSRQAMDAAGLSRLDGFYYAMIPDLTRTCLSQQWGAVPDLSTLSKMVRYLRTLYIGVHVECFYLVLLNRSGRLIRSVLLQKGDADSTPFYLGKVLSTALLEGAKYIVLAHNHPCGTLYPSREDLICTLKAQSAVASLNIPLLDHIIVVPDGAISIREAGLISRLLWNAVNPTSRLVQEWLDIELLVEPSDAQN